MTTFEEDLMEVYYNLKGYFTIKNIPFSPIKKRAGGKGRGEIDLLAVKINTNKMIDAVHIEVGVSVTSSFPFKSNTRPNLDESGKLIKKFLTNDSEHKIREYLGNSRYRCQFISSKFSSKIEERLKERLTHFGAKVIMIKRSDNKILVRINKSGKGRDIEIIPFQEILKEMASMFKDEKLKDKNFQDSRLRAIQHFSRIMYKK